MKCLECLKNVTYLNQLRLLITSDKINCDRCGSELKLKYGRWVFIFDVIQYYVLFMIGIMLYREDFALYVMFMLFFWIELCFFLNLAFNRVEKVK
jgi:DNA-directed RNA polymerase subunit RPC12/RpoP